MSYEETYKVQSNLGDNYKNDEEVLEDILAQMASIASDVSNRDKDDKKLKPYIQKAARAEYLTRGAEGLLSRTEGSESSAFYDIVEKMRNDIIKNHLRRIK